MNRAGALAGVLTGGLAVVIWKQIEGGLFDLYEIVPGILLSTAAIFIASLATPPPAAAVTEGFERFRQGLQGHR
jgi:sodium/proline symporter